MTLRSKMMLLITGMLCGLILLLHFGSSSILQRSLNNAEERIARQSALGAVGVIRAQATQLRDDVADWKTPNVIQLPTGKIMKPFSPSSSIVKEAALLNLHFLLFTDSLGRILWTMNFEDKRPLKADISKPFSSLQLLKQINAGGGARGINLLNLPDGPAFVTARPLAGGKLWLVAAREFGGQQIAQLAAASDLSFSAEPVNDSLSEKFKTALDELAAQHRADSDCCAALRRKSFSRLFLGARR